MVAEVEAARAWEAANLLPRQPASDDPHLLGLWGRLVRAREALRAGTEPRLVRDAHQYLTLEDDPPALIYVEPVRAWCGGGRIRPNLRVDLRADPASVRCDCPAPEPSRPDRRSHCSVALSAIDACLDALSAQGAAAEGLRVRVRASLAVTPWERALGELDAVLARSTPRDDKERQLGWRLTVAPGEPPRVQPVLCKPYSSKPGLRTANIGVAALKDELGIDVELVAQLLLPLLCESRRAKYGQTLDLPAFKEFSGDQAGFDILANTHVIGNEDAHRIEPERHEKRHQLIGPWFDSDGGEGAKGPRARPEPETHCVAQQPGRAIVAYLAWVTRVG